MEPSMYLYDREKEAFIKIDRVNSKDVAFIVIPEQKKVIIWHGKNSSRITQYKAGMKVTSLISEKQLYGFKHEVLKEGDEPGELRDFLERNFGKRDLTQEEIAQKDRKLVQSKVERISKKYQEHEESITSPRPAVDESKDPEQKQRGIEGEDTSIPEQAPVEPEGRLGDDTPKPAEASIDDEIKKMTMRIGSDSGESRATAFEKKNLTSDEREVMDEVKREQLKTDNLLNVEQVKILDQEKQEKLKQLESERIRKLEEEKGKVARMEEDRVTKEREFLENKLRKEKEAMMQERKALQEKLKEEEKKRQLQLEREREERDARKQEKMDFEMRKIDLRMKIRGEGVDYIPSPAENEQILYRIEDGKAVRCDTKVITSGMAYLLDMDDRVITWYGSDASLEDQFFTSEIAKLLEGKRESSVDVVNIETGQDINPLARNFHFLVILMGNYIEALQRFKNIETTDAFMVFKLGNGDEIVAREIPATHDSFSPGDTFLLDFGDRVVAWCGRGSSPLERGNAGEAAKGLMEMHGKEKKPMIIDETREPGYEELPHDAWVILKGQEKAASMRDAHEKAVAALEKSKQDALLKKQQEDERKRLEEEKRALDEMERIERELLEKEIEKQKGELTPAQIEEKWKTFRRKMRKRRGLPEDEPEPVQPAEEETPEAGSQDEPVQKVLTDEEKAEIREMKIKEHEQLYRIELEMLEKQIKRTNPSPEEEGRLRKELEEKMARKLEKLEQEYS